MHAPKLKQTLNHIEYQNLRRTLFYGTPSRSLSGKLIIISPAPLSVSFLRRSLADFSAKTLDAVASPILELVADEVDDFQNDASVFELYFLFWWTLFPYNK